MNTLTPDVLVGSMVEGPLSTKISVRGGNIVLGYFNAYTLKGVEVTYSPGAIQKFNDLLSTAVRVSQGRG